MDLGITEKLALVTGASGGLGGAIAQSLANAGAHVVIAGRNLERLQKLAAQIKAQGGTAHPLAWDLSDLDATHKQLQYVQQHIGDVDILVNNSGGPPPSSALGVAPEVWEEHFRAMTSSLIVMANQLVPGMRERKWGRVITSTSSGAIAPIPNLAVSNTLRAGLVAWSKTLAAEIAPDGVTVNVMVPGRIATRRIEALDAAKAKRDGAFLEEVVRASTGAIPVGRYGKPEEYGDVAAFLASERASYITGTVVRVDGGYIPSV